MKEELKKKGYKIWVPDLPVSDIPDAKRYTNFILANKAWKFNNESIVIGHSSGAVEILHLLQHLSKGVRIKKSIFVSIFKNNLGESTFDGLFEEPFNFDEIKKHSEEFIFVHSDNDPYCPLSHAEYLAGKLGGKLMVRKGQGHFNLGKGIRYKRFPFLLKLT
ncbi:MAG: hypothetical protein UX13_C0002G0008 [Candidatus Woesebacteria bacterium GW2011_GWB1_45_5]|uniref:Alpha/beta hydrolase n=1 Tax=Candidatus Woesebacteria bacterium GW2011_GWB1_45_5 TaxID=1618581 RepID=A0A0G1PZF6_9BACT|nr:MAG: hypothetical protein UX13_C0002G0008 [Candidatus Woesebacteria bacterium GW2011_GWB1_45_5]